MLTPFAGVYYTGGSLNPARSFGPDVVLGSFDGYHWIYWVGPFLGSLVAVLFYKIVKSLEYETANPGADFNEKEADKFNPSDDPSSAEEVKRPTSDGAGAGQGQNQNQNQSQNQSHNQSQAPRRSRDHGQQHGRGQYDGAPDLEAGYRRSRDADRPRTHDSHYDAGRSAVGPTYIADIDPRRGAVPIRSY